MKQTLSSFVYLFEELLSCIEVIGVEDTIKTLQDVKSRSLIKSDLTIDFIINIVADVTSLSRDRIINGKDKNDERKMALALCVHFLKNEFNYSYKDLSPLLKNEYKSNSAIVFPCLLIWTFRIDPFWLGPPLAKSAVVSVASLPNE